MKGTIQELKQKLQAGFMLELNLSPEVAAPSQVEPTSTAAAAVPQVPAPLEPQPSGAPSVPPLSAVPVPAQQAQPQMIPQQMQMQMSPLTVTGEERVSRWVAGRWPHSTLLEAFERRLTFRVPKLDVPSLSQAFAALEAGSSLFESILNSFSSNFPIVY